MFPALVVIYLRLARTEEEEALARFGEAYRIYREATPMFVPAIRCSS
jgi:protein-S-isoprenylcysteine O-methyltransferase Ste14